MKVWSDSFKDNGPIPPRFAFGKHNPKSNVELSDNLNPHLGWTDLPAGTQSLAVICHDPDVPSKGDELPEGLLFIAYGDLSSRLMGGDTHGSGMPTSKGIDVELEPLTA